MSRNGVHSLRELSFSCGHLWARAGQLMSKVGLSPILSFGSRTLAVFAVLAFFRATCGFRRGSLCLGLFSFPREVSASCPLCLSVEASGCACALRRWESPFSISISSLGAFC